MIWTNQKWSYKRPVVLRGLIFFKTWVAVFPQRILGESQNRLSVWNYLLAPSKWSDQASSRTVISWCSVSQFNKNVVIDLFGSIAFIHVRQTVVVGCDHARAECLRGVRHTYGILRPKQTLYNIIFLLGHISKLCV